MKGAPSFPSFPLLLTLLPLH